MEKNTLVDKYCPVAHSAPITGAAFDPQSGASITADSWGVVAMTQPGQSFPAVIFQPGGPVSGAVAVAVGGSLCAVGDDYGTIGVYKSWDGTCVFNDYREGDEGPARAMRAACFNPNGSSIACLAIDGIIRVYDIARWERVANWQGFSGDSLEFDEQGERLLAIDTLGQPKLLDLISHEQIDLEMVPGGVQIARFSPDSRFIITMGVSGISLIELPGGRIVNSFTARGSSGMLNILIGPGGDQVAAITARSIHSFSLPDLQPISSEKHGAINPTKAAIWDWNGVAVGDDDGHFMRPGSKGHLPPVLCVTGYGIHRVAVHGERIAIWKKGRQKRPFNAKRSFVEIRIDRDARLLAGLPSDPSQGVCLYELSTGRFLFDAGPDTADTIKMELGGTIFAVMLKNGGMRWYDLKNNSVFELPWVQDFALSGGGTWIGALTPKGQVRVIDPQTGEEAIPAPEPLAEVPIKLVSFVNRKPDMLVIDEEGVLSSYDLAPSVTEGVRAQGEDILDFNVDIDKLWGITGGKYAALRIQDAETETATILFVDLEGCKVVSEVPNLLPYTWVDPETGHILQPMRGSALLEMDMYGEETRVFRALPEKEWVCFGPQGIIDASENAGV